ncbi:MAG: DNA repair protein RecO [Bacteroidota bacterium]
MLNKTKGIVLHHLKYGDSSIIAHIFTREYGRKSFIIKGVRSRKSKVRSNMFQILNILELEFHHKENKNLQLVKEAGRSKLFNSFPYDILKSTQAMFIAEVLHNCIAEGDPDLELFDFLESTFEYFDLMEDKYANFHLAFMMKLTRFLGIQPSDKGSSLEFNMKMNSIDEMTSRYFPQMRKEYDTMLYQLYNSNYRESSGMPLSREKRNSILKEIMRFYTSNGYNLNKIKSLAVLNELFL